MKIFFAITLTTTILIEANQTQHRHGTYTLNPQYAGTMHTEAFEILSDMYSVQKPSSRKDMVTDASVIMASFCEEGDSSCKANALPLAIQHFRDAENDVQGINYSDDFDPKLMVSIQDLESAIKKIGFHNVDNMLDEIMSIRTNIEDTDNVQAHHKDAALSGLSVAYESIELWNKVYSNSSHPLYGIHYPSHYLQNDSDKNGRNNRKLQNIDIAGIVMADFQGGLNAAMDTSTDVLTTVFTVASNAIPASLAKLFGNSNYYGEEGMSDYYNGRGDDYIEGYGDGDGDGYNTNGDGYYESKNDNDAGGSSYYEEEADGFSDDEGDCLFGFLCY